MATPRSAHDGAVSHSTTPVAATTAPPTTRIVETLPSPRAVDASAFACAAFVESVQTVPPHTALASLHLLLANEPNTKPAPAAAPPTIVIAMPTFLRAL